KLIYQDLEALVAAARKGNPQITQFETSCFSGDYITGDVSEEYLAYLEAQRRDGARRQREDAAPSNQLDLNLLTVD
ncbi:MAG: amidophosphoribosyltransferase, partial [Burkholderiales bacterium]